jgi:predicted O-methyltransferase YrrM
MSSTSTLVTARHFEYIAERTAQEDGFIQELKAAARAEGLPAIWVAPEQASLMGILLQLAQVHTVVEVGTLAGSTAIQMARALPEDGHVHTIELSAKHAAFARGWIERSDVAGRVTVHEGAGSDVLPTFATGSIDAAFLDADKSGYGGYLVECRRMLRPGGLLMVDNAFAFGQLFEETPTDGEAPAVKAFNEVMARDETFGSIIVPVGDGLWVGVRR